MTYFEFDSHTVLSIENRAFQLGWSLINFEETKQPRFISIQFKAPNNTLVVFFATGTATYWKEWTSDKEGNNIVKGVTHDQAFEGASK